VWPGASWSSIDWFGRPKALQFHARRFFAPVAVAALRDARGATRVSLLNDRTHAVQGTLRTRVMSLDGAVLRDAREAITIAPLSAGDVGAYADADLLAGADPTLTVAVFTLEVDGEPASTGVVYFVPAKDVAWRDPGLHTTVRRDGDGYRIEISAATLARGVWLDAGDVDAQFHDNALTVLPGEPVTVRVTSTASDSVLRAALHVRSLRDATRATNPTSWKITP